MASRRRDLSEVTVRDAAEQLLREEVRIIQLLNTKCPLLVATHGEDSSDVFELVSRQGLPSPRVHAFGRTVYQWSIDEFKARHAHSPKGRWLHPRPNSISSSHSSGTRSSPRIEAGGPQDGTDSLQVLVLKLSDAGRQAREREQQHLGELLRMERELERVTIKGIEHKFNARREKLRRKAAGRIDARETSTREALEDIISQYLGPQDADGLADDKQKSRGT